jgi:DNA-binding NarL/FixJ family response regulator
VSNTTKVAIAKESATVEAASVNDAPTVVIADDHPTIRLGVRMALLEAGMRVLAETADREGAIEAVLREQPDLCLLDIHMPGGGIEAAAALAVMAPHTAVVMLTVSTSMEDVLAALRAGAVGYLPKDTPPDRLPAALRGVLAGEPALPRAFVGPVLGELHRPSARASDPEELTKREAQIMHMLGAGLRTAEIAKALTVSPVTVRRHISAAVAKLGVADRREALRALNA